VFDGTDGMVFMVHTTGWPPLDLTTFKLYTALQVTNNKTVRMDGHRDTRRRSTKEVNCRKNENI
jgi:hypothetical protein